MTTHARTVRVTTFRALEGHFDDLVGATTTNAQDATAADGCFGAQVLQTRDHPDVVAVISRWRDSAALETFLGQHEAIAHQAVAGLIDGPVASTHYEALPD